MKKAIQLLVGFLFFSGLVQAQVLTGLDFETAGSMGIFSNKGWGTAPDSVYQVADPTGNSNGVLAVHFTLHGVADHNAIGLAESSKGQISANGAHAVCYWLYLPADTPDSLQFGLFFQASGNWTWNERYVNAKEIPKQVWFPIYYSMRDSSISNSANNDILTHNIGDFGIQFNNYHIDSTSAGANWTGTIYVDNISLIGAQPHDVTPPLNFETAGSIAPFRNEKWGAGLLIDSMYQKPDPTGKSNGVLDVHFKLQGKGDNNAVGLLDANKAQINGANAHLLSYDIFLPADTPDSLQIGLYFQASTDWSWNERYIFPKDLPKEVWYHLYYFMLDSSIASPASDDIKTHNIGDFGIQFASFRVDSTSPAANWSGDILIDNVQLLNAIVESTGPTGPEWIISAFDSTALGTDGWAFASWGTAGTTISRTADPTPDHTGDGALRCNFDFSTKGQKGFVSKKGIPLYNSDSSSTATTLSVDILPHATFPAGSQFGLVITGEAAVDSGWLETKSAMTNGVWGTITVDLQPYISAGTLDPTKYAEIGVQVYNGTDTLTKAPIWIDNLKTWGTGPLVISGVNDKNNQQPIAYRLYNNYPNPFNPSTTIKYDLSKESNVVIKVYDVLGKEVATLVNQKQPSGNYSVKFDASRFASGVYIYRIQAGSFVKSNKMMLLK